MIETRKIVKAFLASPGDLSDERKMVKRIVDEFNDNWSSYFGYQIELMGWEDTVSGAGRPQEIINQDLNRCELFIGLMWMRWGTPPDVKGRHTSGFEEEFELSVERKLKTNKPEISLFFKDIDEGRLIDPGVDLKKVLDFKKKLRTERKILYNEFNEELDFGERIRKKLTKYVQDLIRDEQSNSKEEGHTKSDDSELSTDLSTQGGEFESPFSLEGHDFLFRLVEKSGAKDSGKDLSALEVARLRLLANTISKYNNDNPSMGIHDANIIFSNKSNLALGQKEIYTLINSGLENINFENVPLWNWYYLENKVSQWHLGLRAIMVSQVKLAIGAIEAMRLIGKDLIGLENSNRDPYLEEWFADDTNSKIKIAALNYLKQYGHYEDLSYIQKEFDKGNADTSRLSIETILSIKLRKNVREAVETAIRIQFESIDNNLLKQLMDANLNIDNNILRLGMKHRNEIIRMACIKKLIQVKNLGLDEVKAMAKDDSPSMRYAFLCLLLEHNPSIPEAEITNILDKTKALQGASIMAAKLGRINDDYYDRYLLDKYSKVTEKQLLEKSESDSLFDYRAYVVLSERFFKKHSRNLRKNVADHFVGYSVEKKKEYAERFGTYVEDRSQEVIELEVYVRRKLTRKALDILCRKGDSRGIGRVRENLSNNFVESSIDEIQYLKKFGGWDDIPLIVKAEEQMRFSRSSFAITDVSWYRLIADAIFYIGGSKLEDLLNIDMRKSVFAELVSIIPASRFSKLSEEAIFKMLNSKEKNIRKICALKCIKSFSKSKLKLLLKKYIGSDDYRYYNVIYWLDFGISLPKKITTNTIRVILNN